MASFVESATLALVDKTTANVNKINKSLDGLFKRVKKLQAIGNKEINLKIKTTSLTRAMNTLDRAQEKARAFGRMTIEPKLRLNANQAISQLANVKRAANFAAKAELRLDTARANRQISAFRSRMNFNLSPNVRANNLQAVANQTRLRIDHQSFFNAGRQRVAEWGAIFAERVASDLARTAGKAVVDQNIANVRAAQTTLNDRDAAAVIAGGRDLSSGSRVFSDAEAQKQIVENLGTTKGNVQQAVELGFLQNRYAEALRAAGDTMETVQDSLTYYVKSLDKTGKLYDKQGNIEGGVDRRVGLLAAADIVGGKDVTGATINNAVNNLGLFAKTISDFELLVTALQTEEYRTRAATMRTGIQSGLNTATKESKAKLRGAGLLDENNNIVNSKLFAENTSDWIQIYGTRALERIGMSKASETDQLYALAKLFSNSKQGGNFAQLFAGGTEARRQAVYAQQLAESGRITSSPEGSITVAGDNVVSAFESIVSRISAPIEGPLVTAVNSVGNALQGIADWVLVDGKVDPTKAGVVAGGGLAAALAAAFAGKKVLDWINPLTGSAKALTTAAAQLSTAAAALQRSAGVNPLDPNNTNGKTKNLGSNINKMSAGIMGFNMLEMMWNAPTDAAGWAEAAKNKRANDAAWNDWLIQNIPGLRHVASTDLDRAASDAGSRRSDMEYYLRSPKQAQAEYAASFNKGEADAMRDALTQGSADLATRVSNGAGALGDGIVAGATTAAGILAAAIAGAAAQIRVAASAPAVAATPTLDTGHNTFGPR